MSLNSSQDFKHGVKGLGVIGFHRENLDDKSSYESALCTCLKPIHSMHPTIMPCHMFSSMRHLDSAHPRMTCLIVVRLPAAALCAQEFLDMRISRHPMPGL